MTDCYITAGTLTMQNPIRTGDPFSVTFTYHHNGLLPEDFTYKIYAIPSTEEPTLMAIGHDIWGMPFVDNTRIITCDGGNCWYWLQSTPPSGTEVMFVLEVSPDGTPDGYSWWPLSNRTTAPDNGNLAIEGAALPSQVIPLQVIDPFNIDIHATGNPVYEAMAGIYQIDGPTIQVKMSGGIWTDLPTSAAAALYTHPIPYISNAIQTVSVGLRMPDAGFFDWNTGRTATIGIIAARKNALGGAIQYPPAVNRTTYMKSTTPTTCTEGSERCVKADNTPGGCRKQVCNGSNQWVTTSENDPLCPNCGTTNHTCLGKSGLQVPAGTQECGHEGMCFKSTCSGITGLWGNPVKDTTCGTGTQCADPVCTSGQTSCDPVITRGTACTKYDCISGQWRKSADQGIVDCGVTCAIKNPMVIGAIAVGVVGVAAIYYLISSRSPTSNGKTYSRWEAPDYPRQRRR